MAPPRDLEREDRKSFHIIRQGISRLVKNVAVATTRSEYPEIWAANLSVLLGVKDDGEFQQQIIRFGVTLMEFDMMKRRLEHDHYTLLGQIFHHHEAPMKAEQALAAFES